MANNDNISLALSKWASGEMEYNVELNRAMDFSSYEQLAPKSVDWDGICLGPMSDVWAYIVIHVRSTKSAEVIKGNLKLHSSSVCDNVNNNLKSLILKRNKLKLEVSELESQNKQLHEQFSYHNSKFVVRKKHLTQFRSLARNHRRTVFLLNMLTNKIQHHMLLLRDSSSASEGKISNFIPTMIPDGNEERYKIDVAKMSKLMQESLVELILESPNIEKIQSLKQEVGLCLATLLTRIPHPHFLRLLQECQEADSSKISQLTVTKSYVDLHDLDLINQSINSVQQQLSDLSWFYANQLSFSESKSKLADNLKRQLNTLHADIQNQFEISFQSREDLLKIAKELVRINVKYASYDATLTALKKISTELRKNCASIEANRDEVESANERIDKNVRLMDHYSTLICTLAKKHAENISLMTGEIRNLMRLLNDEAPSLRTTLISAADSTRNHLERNEAFFYTFKPSTYFHTKVESLLLPTEILATNRMGLLDDVRTSQCTIQKSFEALGINHMSSAYHIHRSIGKKTLSTLRMRQTAKWYAYMMSEITEKHKYTTLSEKSFQYSELVPTAKEKQKYVVEEVASALDSRMKKIEDASKFVADVERAMFDWNDEPAKLIETGAVVNGQTLDECRKNITKDLLSGNAEKGSKGIAAKHNDEKCSK